LYEAVGTAHKVFSETWFHEGNTKVYLAITAIPEYNEQKEVDSVLFVAHDITDQKLAEAEIRRKNTSITESIRYSQSIQSSLMPTDRVFHTFLGDSFLFYQPRDIISGDFPWIFRQNQYLYMAIADCTGHGVPGALLSLVGYFQLNNVVEKNIGASCGVILDQLNQRVREILRQDSGESMTKDGMDIALLRWDTRSQELEFSGAHRPLLYLDEQGQLCEIRGDRTPIAGFQRKQAQPFSTHRVQCTGKEKFFLFTDGLPDQFGGEGGKEKLMMARIRETIEAHRHESAATIGNHLRELYFHWMGNTRQIDDVLLLSFSMSPSQNFLN
jgi:serine phosphatase RsbU (regulator of sigma subunit)